MRRICEGLLGPCSGISAWMCSWGRWDAEIPVLWDAPHVLRRPRGDSLRLAAVCREVINQDCCRHPLGSGSQIGWSFPRLLPLIFPLEWGEKKPFSLIIHSSWCTAFCFITKIFSSSSSYTSALQPHCFCQSGGQMFTLKSGGMRNRLKGKWITEEIVFLSWHLYFLIQGSGNSVLSLRTSVCMKYYSTHLSPGRRGCAGVMWC